MPISQGGYFHIKRLGGGLDLASSLEAKFGARFSQVHQIRGKIWGVLLLQDAKIGKERAKFGVSVTYIFGGKIWGSDMNFRGKIWGQALPTPLYGSTPSGAYILRVQNSHRLSPADFGPCRRFSFPRHSSRSKGNRRLFR